MICQLWFDGATEPRNPGGWMMSAFILRIPGQDDVTGCNAVEPATANTNNIAEWNALLAGIAAFNELESDCDALEIRGDSQLVIRQLNGEWACNKDHLRKLRAQAITMLDGVTWCAEWVSREQNTEADALTRTAYEMVTGQKMSERGRRSA